MDIPNNDFLDLNSIILYKAEQDLKNYTLEENPVEYANLQSIINNTKPADKTKYDQAYTKLQALPLEIYLDQVVALDDEWSAEYVSSDQIIVFYRNGIESAYVNTNSSIRDFARSSLLSD